MSVSITKLIGQAIFQTSFEILKVGATLTSSPPPFPTSYGSGNTSYVFHSSFSRKCNGAFAVNFDLMGRKVVGVAKECHFVVAHLSLSATAVPISPR